MNVRGVPSGRTSTSAIVSPTEQINQKDLQEYVLPLESWWLHKQTKSHWAPNVNEAFSSKSKREAKPSCTIDCSYPTNQPRFLLEDLLTRIYSYCLLKVYYSLPATIKPHPPVCKKGEIHQQNSTCIFKLSRAISVTSHFN